MDQEETDKGICFSRLPLVQKLSLVIFFSLLFILPSAVFVLMSPTTFTLKAANEIQTPIFEQITPTPTVTVYP